MNNNTCEQFITLATNIRRPAFSHALHWGPHGPQGAKGLHVPNLIFGHLSPIFFLSYTTLILIMSISTTNISQSITDFFLLTPCLN